MYQITTIKNHHHHHLVDGVILHKLVVNQDDRGNLTEIMKSSWEGIYHHQKRPFAQVYCSTTKPGIARDLSQWHYHPGGQEDRFGVIAGDIVAALYDDRKNSPTQGTLNLFAMGQSQGDDGQYLLLIPKKVYHGYLVVSPNQATMFNFPTRLYDPQEEQRLDFKDHRLSDSSVFDWNLVKAAYNSSNRKD